jgi:3-oxoacyl-[acyl-carrier protein] reductase
VDLGLKGAAVCISGGTKGMGRQAALAFAAEGARVVVTARGKEGLTQTVNALREIGAPDAFGVETDAGNPASIESLFGEIGDRWGELHTLINMVGPTDPSQGRHFAEVPDEQWRHYFDVGIMSVVRCTRAALPLMRRAGWGRVINISSISSRLGLPMEAPYMTAKAGMNALSKNIAWALAAEGILVNTVTPGVVQTEALRHFVESTDAGNRYDPDNLQDVWQWMRNTFGSRYAGVIGRVALPAEVNSLLLLLGSRANSYIVGANIPIDGGTDFSGG